MNPGAVQKLLTSRFQLGADASVAVGELGAGVGAGTTVQFGEDVYAFARNMGLFGGLALDGTYVKPQRRLEPDLLWPAADRGADRLAARWRPRCLGTQALRESLAGF